MVAEMVDLQFGLVVPLPAYLLVLECEKIGVSLAIVGAPGSEVVRASGPKTDAIRDGLCRWRQHVMLLLNYRPSDHHLYDDRLPFPQHGPVINRSRAA